LGVIAPRISTCRALEIHLKPGVSQFRPPPGWRAGPHIFCALANRPRDPGIAGRFAGSPDSHSTCHQRNAEVLPEDTNLLQSRLPPPIRLFSPARIVVRLLLLSQPGDEI